MSRLANIPHPQNEPVLSYAPGSAERAALKGALTAVGAERPDIPAVVAGREIRSGVTQSVVSPHCHARVLATLHRADPATIDAAVATAVEAQHDWAHWRFEDRAAVFLKAADLLAAGWRQRLNAATMLGQSKTAFQAEIDSACELIDFLRFNVHFAERIYREQPDSAPGAWNRMDHRPLEGFVYAITPFNFTAIGGNLPTAPALMGNTVVWKPAHSAALSNWHSSAGRSSLLTLTPRVTSSLSRTQSTRSPTLSTAPPRRWPTRKRSFRKSSVKKRKPSNLPSSASRRKRSGPKRRRSCESNRERDAFPVILAKIEKSLEY